MQRLISPARKCIERPNPLKTVSGGNMRIHNGHLYRCIFLWSAAIALGGAPGIRVRAQQTQQYPQTQQAQVPRQDADNDRANFDQFLSQHKDIAKDLRDRPGRLNDPDYLKSHKELQTFFDRNSRAKEELRQDPSFFTRRENRFETNATPKQRADRNDFLAKHKDIAGDLNANPGLVNDNDYLRRHNDLRVYLDKDPGMRDNFRNRADNDRNRSEVAGNARGNPNPDLTRQELATMDQFLDTHPDIDRELRANPRLIDDPNYMRTHPQLQAFFAQNPVVLNEFREIPNYFMRRENQFDARNPDTNLPEKQRRDRDDFLAKHKDIDRDLQANPALANDNDYLNRHRDLRAFLDKDPDVRADYRYRSGPVDRDRDRDANLTPKQRADRDDFLAKHKDIDRDLQANPALVNDNDYLNRHKDLRVFLDKDPDVRERVRSNPSSIVPSKTETTPSKAATVPAKNERPNGGKSSDVKSDKADIKSDKSDIKSDRAAKGDKADIKADKADVKSDKADIKADKAADKDKPKKPSKPSDTKPPIEQREEAQPSH
jgi:hypothetical protein